MDWLNKLFGKRDEPSPPKTPVIASVQLPQSDQPVTAYGDQPLRKAWAETVLQAEGVPTNLHLPMIESESQITLRTPSEIANRLRALAIIAARGAGLSQANARDFVKKRGIGPHLTSAERAFLETREPSQRDQIQFSWRYEAAWVLFWALGHVDGPLGPPRDTCDVDTMTDVIINVPDLNRRAPRSANDVLNEADLAYRYHWAVRQADIDGANPPAGLNPSVVLERHHALNWLIGYNDNADWEEVTTDT